MKKIKKRIVYRLPEAVYALGAVIIALATWIILDNIGTVSDMMMWIGLAGGAVMLIGTAMIHIRDNSKVRRGRCNGK